VFFLSPDLSLSESKMSFQTSLCFKVKEITFAEEVGGNRGCDADATHMQQVVAR
jgi:hypothetical protein